ncbi:hypothetical protein [Flavobacterium subsaxonicum]|uniref:Lipoprotein n=1 Tax=Flavobacterium subsaxonicum WB 4.1-42 = DSM 21790 TaxID=1121898 RepID=A0A0A2MJN2_9FLAO|nr:hypothetical protein [Flavobacterium subsaxonicum]KGO91791.1 hypothetical protein Q766_16275 [Flavobacterium subsaxonicum WB 4.1-42 = DSM 21790]
MKQLCLLLLAIFLTACTRHKKQQPDSVALKPDTTIPVAKTHHYEPETTRFEFLGTVQLNSDTIKVIEEYTNNIAFKQPAVNEQGVPDELYYREKVVHLINKHTTDTLTVTKKLFKKHIGLQYYDDFIVQAALFRQPTKTGIVPLMINLCEPDTDSCLFYVISIKNGQLHAEPFNEDDFVEEQE